MEVKVKLRCETWEEFADRIHKMVNEKSEQIQAKTDEGAGEVFVKLMRDVSCIVEQAKLYQSALL